MKKILIVLVIAVVIVGGAILYWGGGLQALGLSMPDPAAQVPVVQGANLPPIKPANEINVEGRLVPAEYKNLSFNVNGILKEVLVKEGQAVEKGQIIARLRDENQMRLAVSKSELEVMNAEKALNDLRINAPLTAAQLNYDIVITQKELEKAEKRRVAMNYPRVSQKKIDDAYKAYIEAEDAVKQISDHAIGDKNLLEEAQQMRDTARANYNYLISKYTSLEKAEAEAIVALNKSKIADLTRRYEILSKGPDPAEERLAQARLDIAQSELEAAQSTFEDLVLRAPFTGTVVEVNLEEGANVSFGTPVILVANLSRWHIETEDLSELNVTRIQEGAPASVAFDALPDTTFDGKVIDIKNYGVNKQGDITYTATIEIASSDPRLRWNMTSPIVIKTQ